MSDVEQHIAEKLLPALRAAIARQLGEATKGEWSLEIDSNNAQTVNFHYPTALPEAEYMGMTYITPRVKLELGARGDPWPTEEKVIRPYAAEDYPDFFEDAHCTVTVLSAQRNFWEKATALHAEAHRPAESPLLPGSSPSVGMRHKFRKVAHGGAPIGSGTRCLGLPDVRLSAVPPPLRPDGVRPVGGSFFTL